MSEASIRKLHKDLAHGVLYVEVEDSKGAKNIGTSFHVGDGIFVTANHVVRDRKITAVGTNVTTFRLNPRSRTEPAKTPQEYVVFPRATFLCESVFVSKSEDDVALLRVPTAAHLPVFLLGTHLNELMGDEMVLSHVLVMGYPPIPCSDDASLVSVTAEVNAISHKREPREARYATDRVGGRYRGHPHFVISSTARGGFSGAPAVHEDGFVLGLVTESLVRDGELPVETGYMAVLSVEPIYLALKQHGLMPKIQSQGFDGLWDRDTEELKRLLNTPGIEVQLDPLPPGGTLQDLVRYVVKEGNSTRITTEPPKREHNSDDGV